MEELLAQIRNQYPSIDIEAYETNNRIEVMQIYVPPNERNSGIGSNVLKQIQQYAKEKGKPIVLRPEPERGQKANLDRFYKRHGFVHNKGKNIDYALSSPLAKTMYWRFKEWMTLEQNF